MIRTKIPRGKALWRYREKTAIHKSRGETSEETNPGETLTLDFKLPELWGNKCLLFKPTSLWYFVMVALANGHITLCRFFLQLLRVHGIESQHNKWPQGYHAFLSSSFEHSVSSCCAWTTLNCNIVPCTHCIPHLCTFLLLFFLPGWLVISLLDSA